MSDSYQAYYLAPDGIVDGLKGRDSWPCGTCSRGEIYFVSWLKEYPNEYEQPYDSASVKDFSPEALDKWLALPLVQAVLNDAELPEDAQSVVRYLVSSDRMAGLTGEQIAEKRADILSPNFLGFTYDYVVAEHPWILEDGSTFTQCNWGGES